MEFYNNSKNDKLNFKINIEGIDINNIEPRLIITNGDDNYLFYGKIKENICTFDVPELTSYKKDDTGKVKFEIISEDLYFPVWSDEFEIKSKVSVKIEELYQEVLETAKPEVSASVIKTEKEEVKKEEVKKEEPKKIMEKRTVTVERNNNPKKDPLDDILKREEEKERMITEQLKELEKDNTEEVEEEKIEEAKHSYKKKIDKDFIEKHKHQIRRFTDL